MKRAVPSATPRRRNAKIERLERREYLAADLELTWQPLPTIQPGDAFELRLDGKNVGDVSADQSRLTTNVPSELTSVQWQLQLGENVDAMVDGATLGTTEGVVLRGGEVNERLGRKFESAGDFNGDGIEDFLLQTVRASTQQNQGVYVLFGPLSENPSLGPVPVVDGINGVFIEGSVTDVSRGGDFNGDGIDDILLSTSDVREVIDNQSQRTGEVQILFGSQSPFPSSINPDAWVASGRGATIKGPTGVDYAGTGFGDVVAGGGDVNGDGFDDIVVSAPEANVPWEFDPSYLLTRGGVVYVVMGGTTGLGEIRVTDIPSNRLATIRGTSVSQRLGEELGIVGDVYGNSFDELLISSGQDGGAAFLYRGTSLATTRWSTAATNVATGDATEIRNPSFGNLKFASAGDVNGDSREDLLIANEYGNGNAYVMFGQDILIHSVIRLEPQSGERGFIADGVNGFSITGLKFGGGSGPMEVASGDFNGDGRGDTVVGVRFADVLGRDNNGAVAVLFGKDSPFAASSDVSTLDGANGYVVAGPRNSDGLGQNVAFGDYNNDGFDDLLLGFESYDFGGTNNNVGAATVLFGRRAAETRQGTGAIDERIDLGAGQTFSLQMTASAPVNPNGPIAIVAQASLNPPQVDPTPGNNVATALIDLPVPIDLRVGVNSRDDELRINQRFVTEIDVINDSAQTVTDAELQAAFPTNWDDVIVARESYLSDSDLTSSISLESLDGQNGRTISGEFEDAKNIGDFNGDGLDDFVVTASNARVGLNDRAGTAYVIFGNDNRSLIPTDLESLDGVNGFKVLGEVAGGRFARNLESAGDFNGDGFDDFIVSGAPFGNFTAATSPTIVFGRAGIWPSTVTLSSLPSTGKSVVDGLTVEDVFLSSAGDVDGDGHGDVLFSTYNFLTNVRRSTLIFGSSTHRSTIPTGIHGSDRVTWLFDIPGLSFVDVSGGGDVNNDGRDDLAFTVFDTRSGAFRYLVHVIHGQTRSSIPTSFSSLDGTNGFTLIPESKSDNLRGATIIGDLNGDGFDEIATAYEKDVPFGSDDLSGVAVVYGTDQHPAAQSLGRLNGQSGFTIDQSGPRAGDWTIASQGDFNGDGFDDLAVSVNGPTGDDGQLVDPNEPAVTYVLYGNPAGISSRMTTDQIRGTRGQRLIHPPTGAFSGRPLRFLGDVDSDGRDDLIVVDADVSGSLSEMHVVYGTARGVKTIMEAASLPSQVTIGPESGLRFTVGGVTTSQTSSLVVVTTSVTAPSGQTDSNPANNSQSLSRTIRTEGDLRVNLTASTAPVVAGETFQVSAEFRNEGPTDVMGARVQLTVGELAASGDSSTSAALYISAQADSMSSTTWERQLRLGDIVLSTVSGVGDVDELVDIPSAHSLHYVLTDIAPLDLAGTGTLLNATAQVTAPAYFVDTHPGDETDSRTETVQPAIQPAVERIVINDGSSSRSYITSLTVTFDTQVEHAALSNAFSVRNIDTGTNVGSIIVDASDVGGKTIAVLQFAGDSTQSRGVADGLPRSLADGNYELTIANAAVRRASTGVAMAAPAQFGGQRFGEPNNDQFFRLLGDHNGDGFRNFADLNVLLPTILQPSRYRSDLDANGDGFINFADLNLFLTQLFKPRRL